MMPLQDDDGAGALWLMLLSAAVLPVALGVSLLLHVAAVRQSVTTGAELAALSGSCDKARVIATQNGVELVDCVSTVGEVKVTVRGVLLNQIEIFARARAVHER